MKRFVPRSLAGQMALLLGMALLIAQLASFALILNERQKLSLAQNEGPAITRFAGVAADVTQASPEFRSAVVSDASRRGARFTLGPQANPGATRDQDVEQKLTSALADTGLRVGRVQASRVARDAQGSSAGDRQSLRLSADLGSAGWLNGQIVTSPRDPLLPARLALATALLFVLVLGATLWMANRIARPLRALTTAADLFGGKTQPVSVRSSGPADLRKAIDAFNAMNARVVSLLDDKDRTLGAIGHDLRTPLTSLRIRLESMDPPEERDAVIAKIEEMTATIEDILLLARTGRVRGAVEPVDLCKMVEDIAAEARSTGADVTVEARDPCIVIVDQASMRRAVRNLVDNAVNYGGDALVTIDRSADHVEIRVSDRGPGIPDDRMAEVLQPFVRLEASRSRDTGGTGLGLAIAAGIAEAHGGMLTLRSNQPRGLVAAILLPSAMNQA